MWAQAPNFCIVPAESECLFGCAAGASQDQEEPAVTTVQTSDVTSPPASERSPPASRRRLGSSPGGPGGSQGGPGLFSSPPTHLPTSELSSPLTYGTPSSRLVGTPGSRAGATPIRQRSDVASIRMREINLNTDPVVKHVSFFLQVSFRCHLEPANPPHIHTYINST